MVGLLARTSAVAQKCDACTCGTEPSWHRTKEEVQLWSETLQLQDAARGQDHTTVDTQWVTAPGQNVLAFRTRRIADVTTFSTPSIPHLFDTILDSCHNDRALDAPLPECTTNFASIVRWGASFDLVVVGTSAYLNVSLCYTGPVSLR